MAKTLRAFLKGNAAPISDVEVIVSDRFKDDDGNTVPWTVRLIRPGENDDLMKEATSSKFIPKSGMYASKVDMNKYLKTLAITSTVDPDLNDKDLQDSYGVMSASDLLDEMLTAGEYNEYLKQIQKINGFDVSFDDKVDEAKNS